MATLPTVGLAKRVAKRSFGLVRYAARTARYWLSGEAFGRFFPSCFLASLLFTITSPPNWVRSVSLTQNSSPLAGISTLANSVVDSSSTTGVARRAHSPVAVLLNPNYRVFG